MSRHSEAAFAKLHEPPPPVLDLILPSLAWGLAASLLASIGLCIVIVLAGHLRAGAELHLPNLIYTCAVANLVLFPLLAAGRLLALSRVVQDKAFTVCGFLATFFGLAMLLVFFAVLAGEVRQWFHYTPVLVERSNRYLEVVQKEIEKSAELKKLEIAKVREEMQAALEGAATPEEKKELARLYEQEVIPDKIKDLDKFIAEKTIEIEKYLRPPPTPANILGQFLTHGPSAVDRPQDAGIYAALLGSLWIAVITMVLAVPIGVGAAVYLEEYKTGGRLGQLIQVNINNLAGVPSVVYGILGAAVLVPLFHSLQRYDSHIAARNVFGGGITLALLTLPIVIVSAQEAIRAVPSSIRQGALALGATKWQTIWHQVLPMASPGILTGTILSLSRAIGEAAPLVLFGALQFVDQEPSLFGGFTVMPMQIFGWADRPATTLPLGPGGENLTLEMWKYNAALACVVLLVILLTLNGAAIILRNRSQNRLRV